VQQPLYCSLCLLYNQWRSRWCCCCGFLKLPNFHLQYYMNVLHLTRINLSCQLRAPNQFALQTKTVRWNRVKLSVGVLISVPVWANPCVAVMAKRTKIDAKRGRNHARRTNGSFLNLVVVVSNHFTDLGLQVFDGHRSWSEDRSWVEFLRWVINLQVLINLQKIKSTIPFKLI